MCTARRRQADDQLNKWLFFGFFTQSEEWYYFALKLGDSALHTDVRTK